MPESRSTGVEPDAGPDPEAAEPVDYRSEQRQSQPSTGSTTTRWLRNIGWPAARSLTNRGVDRLGGAGQVGPAVGGVVQ